mmetsp:Transcript_1831/g.4023  ORF Transcript_1831/g.4023 Transcript_1831/m.4023 type:complete len:214 (-) Transcript_1831:186-827(-)
MVLLQLLQLVRHLGESRLGLLGFSTALLEPLVRLVQLCLHLSGAGSAGFRLLAHLQGLGLPPPRCGPQRGEGGVGCGELTVQIISLNADFREVRPQSVSLGHKILDESLRVLPPLPFVTPPLGPRDPRRNPHGKHGLLQAPRFRVLRVGRGRWVPGRAQLVTQSSLNLVHTFRSGVAFLLVPPWRPVLLLAVDLVGILSPHHEKLLYLLRGLG